MAYETHLDEDHFLCFTQVVGKFEQATQAERKYDSTLHSLISRAKDERRTVLQETNGATWPVDATPISSRSERLSQPLLCIAVWRCVVRSIATGLGAVEA